MTPTKGLTMQNENFIFYESKSSCRNLILFIHGFTGNIENTWTNKNGNSFPVLLLEDNYIKENFDIASYSYFTTLLNLFADTKEKFRFIKSLIRKETHKKEKNLDINELSNNLSTHIRFTLKQYDNIYIIAHSMGGLIIKNLINNEISKNGATKIKLFVSLAVPHHGAELAVFGKLISSNLQILNLNPVQEFITSMNQNWISLDEKPTTKYLYGTYDDFVTKHSAVAVDKIEKDIISVPDDHTSISKPKDSSSIVYNIVKSFINDEHKHTQLYESGRQQLVDDEQYEEEIFVLKMIIADIAKPSRDNAKELFFNAEYMRKLLSSKYDQKHLDDLVENIRQLYKDCYDNYLADENINSGKLLSEVHSRISAQDSALLKSFIPALKLYHKKGMLHQMANNEALDIWWCRDRTLKIDQGDKL